MLNRNWFEYVTNMLKVIHFWHMNFEKIVTSRDKEKK